MGVGVDSESLNAVLKWQNWKLCSENWWENEFSRFISKKCIFEALHKRPELREIRRMEGSNF